jgi:DNA-binding NarL/FixJ family response regulator
VSNHQSAIKQKLKVDTAIQLFNKAAQMGLAQPR